MPNPHQVPAKQWPVPIRRKCFDAYMLGYPIREICKKYGPGEGTMYAWINRFGWRELKHSLVEDYETRARELFDTSISGVAKSISVASKLLDHMSTRLEAPTPQKCLKTSESVGSHNPLSPEDLETLAKALAASSDVLLRVFGK